MNANALTLPQQRPGPSGFLFNFLIGLAFVLAHPVMAMQALAGALPQERPGLSDFLLDLLSGIVFVVTHPLASTRNALANLVVDLLDAGAGAGTLVFQTSASAEVATCTFSDPAFGNAVNGVATANAIADDTNATGGTTDRFVAQDSDTNVAFAGSVSATGGGEDIELSSTNPGSGDTVGMSSLTYAAPA